MMRPSTRTFMWDDPTDERWMDIQNYPERVLKTYTEDQAGKDIREEDVARPLNQVWAMNGEDEATIGTNSNMGCPTYGNCWYCFSSGPVNMRCQFCKRRDCGFAVMYFSSKDNDDVRIVDAQFISKWFGANHQPAKADRMAYFLTIRRVRLHLDHLRDYFRHKYQGTFSEGCELESMIDRRQNGFLELLEEANRLIRLCYGPHEEYQKEEERWKAKYGQEECDRMDEEAENMVSNESYFNLFTAMAYGHIKHP